MKSEINLTKGNNFLDTFQLIKLKGGIYEMCRRCNKISLKVWLSLE